MSFALHFFQQNDLLYRLSSGLARRDQEVVFLFGAAVSAPLTPGGGGVPGAEGMVDLIRQEFGSESSQLAELDVLLGSAEVNRYQAAFRFLQGRLGQTASNDVIRKAVILARAHLGGYSCLEFDVTKASDDQLRILDMDSGWSITPAGESFGQLAAEYPNRFGRIVLTTNFDPLLQVAIAKAKGAFWRTALQADGSLTQTQGSGCHVIHLHGYWYGSDTLHTPSQLQLPRPQLKASISALLRDKLVVVCGYGGWDDVFTQALMDVALDDSAKPDVLWTFHSKTPDINEHLLDKLSVGITRGRVSLYAGIDCHKFLPELYRAWQHIESVVPRVASIPNLVRVSGEMRSRLQDARTRQLTLQGDDEDAPPLVDLCVGRETDLRTIKDSRARVVFLTGIGGQGKSTLAARYFSDARSGRAYEYFVWRDCKEESERFENQLATVVEGLSNGTISARDLASQSMRSITQLLMAMISKLSVLFVFDNADHYVNLELERATSSLDTLIREMIASQPQSRILLTCRPSIRYDDTSILSFPVEGISLDAARQLFAARKVQFEQSDLEEAHQTTKGHAFWLDLLATRTLSEPSARLRDVLNQLGKGEDCLPDSTLNSIWETLSDRQRLVLRSLAEAVRPETVEEISEALCNEMKYLKVFKALAMLRSMSLVVVKRRSDITDLYELHPLVRRFVRKKFTRPERSAFIKSIINVYRNFIARHRFELEETPTLSTLQYWTQSAELSASGGYVADAIETLVEVTDAFEGSAYSREFSRSARIVLDSFNWVSERHKYKAFEDLFDSHITNLAYTGEWTEIDRLLEKYEMTVSEKDARYIFYCNLRCFSKWIRGEFTDAVIWGRKGQLFKTSSGVDTEYDISHNLALAERDAGQAELAIPTFLEGRSLEQILDPDELEEEWGGSRYGNVGRCLHFMGQVDSALICYQKSAILIEKDAEGAHIPNQGYIRRWIGELLHARKQYRLAALFLEAARRKWEQVSPPRTREIANLQHQLFGHLPKLTESDSVNTERIFLDWISGTIIDA